MAAFIDGGPAEYERGAGELLAGHVPRNHSLWLMTAAPLSSAADYDNSPSLILENLLREMISSEREGLLSMREGLLSISV